MLQIHQSFELPVFAAPSRVKAIVTVGDMLLLLRRPTGEWDLPGGRVDAGETLEQTLERELLEETSLPPRGARFLQSAWRNRAKKPPVHVAFYGCAMNRQTLDQIQLSAEHQEAQLMHVADVVRLTMPPLYAQMASLWVPLDQMSK